MVRVIKYAPKHLLNDNDGDPLFDEKKPLYPVAAEDAFDDLLAGLIHRPVTAPPDAALPEAAPPEAAPPDTAPPEVAQNEPEQVKLPSVEEFHFEEAAAKSMASKLAPSRKPRIKIRRPRYRSPGRDRWRFPDQRDAQSDEHDPDSRDLPREFAPPGGSGRGLFWSFCASILVVMGTSAAFGFVQPLNDLLPKRMGAFLSDVSDGLSAGFFRRADRSATLEVAGASAASVPPLAPPAIPDQPVAAAAVARAVPTTSIAVEVRPSANSGGFGVVERTRAAGAKSEEAFGPRLTAPEPAPIHDTAAEPARPDLAAPPAVSAAPAAPAAPAALGEGNDNPAPAGALQQSARADPMPIPDTPAVAEKPAASAPRPVLSLLSAAQVDSLLARGEKLLQSGDIASARLVYLRVAAAGDRRGAMGVGMTYDPRVYARLPLTSLTPNREQAEIWYKKAGEVPTFPAARETIADRRKPQEQRAGERNAACVRKYSSFEPDTGLYTAHSGVKRPCRLP